MQPEAPSSAGQLHQRRERVGRLQRERGELVDHHHQSGGSIGSVGVAQVGPARRPQPPLSPVDLAVEAGQDAIGQTVVQVRDHIQDVGERQEGIEGRPTLEVDQHEVHLVDRVAGRQPDHEGPQQLALARAGRAGDQRMRSVGDQVDGERPTIDRAQWGDQAVDPGWFGAIGRSVAQQVGEIDGVGAPDGRLDLGVGPAAQVPDRDRGVDDRKSPRRAGRSPIGRRVVKDTSGRCQLEDGQAARRELDGGVRRHQGKVCLQLP